MTDVGDIAEKLLTLEIDTIVSDGIAAERMPSDGQALIRIAQLYKDFLDRMVGEVRDAGSDVPDLPGFRREDGQLSAFDDWNVRTGGLRTFAALRLAARQCQDARAAIPRPNALRAEHAPILARVAGSCGDVQAMLRRMGLKDVTIDEPGIEWAEESGTAWPAFDRDIILVLRRIWETGVDVVVMQTMVRLDGGVTTRVLDGWDGQGSAPVHDLHYRGVDIALARWGFLVQTAKDLAGFFFLAGPAGTGAGLRRFRALLWGLAPALLRARPRLRPWAADLARAGRLRPGEARAALALLGQSLSGTGLTLACPAPSGGGMGANFRLDGSATLRFTAVDALVAGEGLAALARLGGQLASARDALAAIRAALDALVGLLTLLAALAAAAAAVARGASGGTAILGAAAVPLAYAALIPCRRVLLRLAFRALMRSAMGAAVPAALRRADPRRAGP